MAKRAPELYVHWQTPAGGPAVLVFSNAWTDDGMHVMGKLYEVDGVMRLQELTFGPANRSQEISSATLRRIRLDEVLSKVRAQGEKDGKQFDELLADPEYVARMSDFEGLLDNARAIRRAGKAAAKRPPAGARGWGDDFYRMVALEYVELTRAGAPGRGALNQLAERLAKRMGEPKPRHRDNVRDWVAEARRRQLLIPVGRGRGGALPGPRLYEKGDDDG